MTSRFMAVGTVLALAVVILVALSMPGLAFGDSAFLVGVLAALLPLIIHLIGRQRATPHRFAAMSLLLRAERRVARRIELGNLALLALRTLASTRGSAQPTSARSSRSRASQWPIAWRSRGGSASAWGETSGAQMTARTLSSSAPRLS